MFLPRLLSAKGKSRCRSDPHDLDARCSASEPVAYRVSICLSVQLRIYIAVSLLCVYNLCNHSLAMLLACCYCICCLFLQNLLCLWLTSPVAFQVPLHTGKQLSILMALLGFPGLSTIILHKCAEVLAGASKCRGGCTGQRHC